VKCGQAHKAGAGADDKARPEPVAVPCDLNLDLQGHASVAGTLKKTEAGGWQFLPSKVLSPVRQPGRGHARKATEPRARKPASQREQATA